MQNSKGCTKCKQLKSLAEFHDDPQGRFGKQSRCKLCQTQATKRWRTESTDACERSRRKTANKNKAYWRTHNPYEEKKTRHCPHCDKDKSGLDFDECHSLSDGLQSWCRECSTNRYIQAPLPHTLFWVAKSRAKKKGIQFEITIGDVVIPDVCPVLDIPLYTSRGKAGPNSPSLDRMNNRKGYVSGNVCVISYRANVLKGDASVEEVRKVLAYMERQA